MDGTPHTIGIIMDGNRRWARARGVPTAEGHRAGFEKAKEIIRHAFSRGVDTVIIYAFSTENWNRTEEEVGYLMRLFENALVHELVTIAEEGVAIRFLGDLSQLSPKLRRAAEALEAQSREGGSGKTVGIALSYGGRAEILAATNALVARGEPVNEDGFRAALWSSELPDPELIIRTGGEHRLSNFLLWQSAYAELFFIDTLWPDFTPAELDGVFAAYAARERRHGK